MTFLNLVKLPITTIDLSPGSHLLINDVTWAQCETLLTDLECPGLTTAMEF